MDRSYVQLEYCTRIKNLRGSNPRRATYFQVYQTHSTSTLKDLRDPGIGLPNS